MQQLVGRKHWIAIIAITGLCVATLCGARVWFAGAKYMALQMLPLPQPVAEFQLYSTQASSFSERQLRGHWNLVFLGFSHCADICPMELDVIAKVLDRLDQRGQGDNKIRGLFVSLDPERDSQAVIDEYLSGFNSSIVGLRGNHSELAKLTRFFGADYNRLLQVNGATVNVPAGYAVPLGVEQDYQLSHSARIYLVNPSGQYVGSFPPPHDVAQIANDLQMILKR